MEDNSKTPEHYAGFSLGNVKNCVPMKQGKFSFELGCLIFSPSIDFSSDF
jgi:hypothetical protein